MNFYNWEQQFERETNAVGGVKVKISKIGEFGGNLWWKQSKSCWPFCELAKSLEGGSELGNSIFKCIYNFKELIYAY